jgi:hypothetical protein
MLAASVSPAHADTDPRSLRLGAVARPAADLYPGGSGAAQFTVGNPNPFPVRLLSLSFGPVRSSAPVACPPGVLRVHRVRLRAVVPAGATSVTERAPRAFRLSRSAPNGCQGVTFTASATVVAEILDDDGNGGGGATAGGGAGTTAGGGPGAVAGGGPGAVAGGGAGAMADGGPGALAGGGAGVTVGGVGGSAGWAAASMPGVLAQTGAPLLALTVGGATLVLAGGAALRLAARRRKCHRQLT